MPDFRYKAFISYSWADAQWGKWLHDAIETYRTPRQLIGSQGLRGPVPARLQPLFKDREEEAAGASVGAAVERALATSEFLIVICSPNSARSKWVNHEVAWFKTHRDPERILALIVDGEPGAGERQCFPAALTHRVLDDLAVSAEPVDAPLAADARASGDGKRGARLKLAAAMLGVGLDVLVRRDDRRRALRQRWVTAGSLLFGGSMAALAWFAIEARDEARDQRAESDGLVEFMLTDLREKLEPVGRLDALDVVGQRALKYYAGQKPGNLDADALGRRSRALHLVGEIRNIRGDSAAGLAAFRQAAATTQELLARDPDNAQRIFDHAQSVFWVGYIAYERGENSEAEARLRDYKRLADRLVAIDPNKPEWQLESSYAETNLGVMLYELGRYAEAEPAFVVALRRIEAVAAGESDNAERQIELGATVNWLGVANDKLGRGGTALLLHRREAGIYEQVLRRDADNANARNRLAIALQFVGAQQLDAGDASGASASYARSLALLDRLIAIEPENTEWQESRVHGLLAQSEIQTYAGHLDLAEQHVSRATELIAQLIASDPKNQVWSEELQFRTAQAAAEIALARGNGPGALSACEKWLPAIARSSAPDLPQARRFAATFHRIAGDALLLAGRAAQAKQHWRLALRSMPADSQDSSSRLQAARYLLLRRLGLDAQARAVAALLNERGYRHPAYRSQS